MNPAGADDLLVAARSALLDALDALSPHGDALVLVGAQAIYLHTGSANLALAESTKDTDLAIDPRALDDDPLLDAAMTTAGFHRDLTHPQPGAWLSAAGVPVDLMVPAALDGGTTNRRSVSIPPHDRHAARRTPGLEAAIVDHAPMLISSLDPADSRSATTQVAGPAALLVAKLHKLGERANYQGRLVDKDAHDIYRLLVATETNELASRLAELADDPVAGDSVREAIDYLRVLFVDDPRLGAAMAGRAEELVGDPVVASAAVLELAQDLVTSLHRLI